MRVGNLDGYICEIVVASIRLAGELENERIVMHLALHFRRLVAPHATRQIAYDTRGCTAGRLAGIAKASCVVPAHRRVMALTRNPECCFILTSVERLEHRSIPRGYHLSQVDCHENRLPIPPNSQGNIASGVM